ncbi:unnamed protein product [Mesocestoides corti]|nr:unnamed protein product [Mesocestoides corti]
MEDRFHVYNITSEIAKYYLVVMNLPPLAATLFVDLINEVPDENPYSTLKKAIIERTAGPEESRMQGQLSGVDLGNRTPSQLYSYMRDRVHATDEQEPTLRRLWAQHLPTEIGQVVLLSGSKMPLKRLLKSADKMHEWLGNEDGRRFAAGSSEHALSRARPSFRNRKWRRKFRKRNAHNFTDSQIPSTSTSTIRNRFSGSSKYYQLSKTSPQSSKAPSRGAMDGDK